MKPAALVFGFLCAGAAAAQPAVKENTGDLSYAYAFQLPAARGKVGPALALIYSSKANADRGYGYGWDLSPFYIEEDATVPPLAVHETVAPGAHVLVRGLEREVILGYKEPNLPHVSSYALKVRKEPLEFSRWNSGDTEPGWLMKDGAGTRYWFTLRCGRRWLLTAVEDLDGNRAFYEHDACLSGRASRGVRKVFYNLTKSSGAAPGTDQKGTYEDAYAHVVELVYGPNPYGTPTNEAGLLGEYDERLVQVLVKGPQHAGARRTLRGYTIGYTNSASSFQSIRSIVEKGIDESKALPPTEFAYDQALSLELEGESTITQFPSSADTEHIEWADLDGDGLTDLKIGSTWARSVGGVGGQLSFGPLVDIVRSSGGLSYGGVTPQSLRDFDGDGVVDYMRAGTCPAPPYYGLVVNFGKRDAVFGLTFDDSDCIDRAVIEYNAATCGAVSGQRLVTAVEYPDCLVLGDLNGDRALDYALRTVVDTWRVFLAVKGGSGWSFVEWGTVNAVPGVARLGASSVWDRADANGDGFIDMVLRNVQPPGWPAVAEATPEYPAASTWLNLWPGWYSGFLAGGYPFAPSDLGQRYETPEVSGYTAGSVLCTTRVKDLSTAGYSVLDVNGDRVPDFVRRGPTELRIAFGLGIGVSNDRSISGAGGLNPEQTYTATGYLVSAPAVSPLSVLGQLCSAAPVRPAGWASIPTARFVDLDGDAIPDHVSRAPDGYTVFRKGRHIGMDTEAVEPSVGDRPAVAGPLLMKWVKSPGGVKTLFSYASSRLFGDRFSTRPVVTKIRLESAAPVSEALLEPSETRYFYAAGPDVKYGLPHAPGRVDDRGFQTTWVEERSDDGARAWVRKTTWILDSYAKKGLASLVEEGPTDSQTGSSPPTWKKVSASLETVWSICDGGINPEAPLATSITASKYYDLAGTTTRVRAGTITTTSCDAYSACHASVLRSTVQEFVERTSKMVGPSITTERHLVNPGEPHDIDDPLALPLCAPSSCAGTAETVHTKVYSGSQLLGVKTERYGEACRKTEEWTWANSAGAKTNWKQYGYYPSGPGTGEGAFGLPRTVTAGDPTQRGSTRATYFYRGAGAAAVDHLQPWQEKFEALPEDPTPSDGVREDDRSPLYFLYTFSFYEPTTGLLQSTRGPDAGGDAIQRWFYYDALGRKIATTKQPPSQGYGGYAPPGTSIPGIVEAASFDDDLLGGPRSARTYRFSTPVQLTVNSEGIDLAANVAMKSVAYLDELGRVVQARERLGAGTGPPGDGASGVATDQRLSGWKVAASTVWDGAGRARVAWEPYLSMSGAFEHPELRPPVTDVRATVTSFDAEGRPWCVSQEYVPAGGGAPPPAQTCTSNSAHGPSFRLATETRVAVTSVTGQGPFGGWFIRTETVTPDQNVSGRTGSTMNFAGPTGTAYGSIDADGREVWVLRDALGRETGSWRRSSSVSTPNPASTVTYDPYSGFVSSRWDANAPSVTQSFVYDDQGRVISHTAGAAGEHVTYDYSSFGRLTSVREYTTADNLPVLRRETVNEYDLPYLDQDLEYPFVAGKLASTTVSEDGAATTTIAYGYDDAGRLAKRQQWFEALEKRYITVDSTYGADGRVLRSRTFGTAGAVTTTAAAPHLSYGLEYDSAGRPFRVKGRMAGATADTRLYEAYSTSASDYATWGAFDAFGRPPLIKGDNGLAVSARVYDRYSNLLVMECKRAGDLSCETLVANNGAGPYPGESSRDLYRTDGTRAAYTGNLLGEYTDRGTATRYTTHYQTSGKVFLATATPTGTKVGRQNYEEAYTFDGIGNVKSAQVKTNMTSGSWQGNLLESYAARGSGSTVVDQVRSTSTTKVSGTAAPVASSVGYTFDVLNRLRTITRGGVVEKLLYGPTGELMAKEVGNTWTFWVGEYATVTATISGGVATERKVDAHVIFAGTRIASLGTPAGATAARTLYYYRSRLGSVVATSLAGGVVGAKYRYTPYGAIDVGATTGDDAVSDASKRSELGYTNALRLSGSLLHLKTRAYDPELRVFLQVDSVDRLRYAYVSGDPANYSDPTGMQRIHDRQQNREVRNIVDAYDWGSIPKILYMRTAQLSPPTAKSESRGEEVRAGLNKEPSKKPVPSRAPTSTLAVCPVDPVKKPQRDEATKIAARMIRDTADNGWEYGSKIYASGDRVGYTYHTDKSPDGVPGLDTKGRAPEGAEVRAEIHSHPAGWYGFDGFHPDTTTTRNQIPFGFSGESGDVGRAEDFYNDRRDGAGNVVAPSYESYMVSPAEPKDMRVYDPASDTECRLPLSP